MPGMPAWKEWFDRWEAQQSLHLPEREPRFGMMLDVLEAMVGDSPTVIDLGSGPGSLAMRVTDRLPKAHVVAVDADPLLLELGRQAVGDRDGRLRWVDADLRDPAFVESLALDGPGDAAISTTALHWLSPSELVELFSKLAHVLRPGGVFINGDHLSFSNDQPLISNAVGEIRQRIEREPRPPGSETWSEWWAAINADPAFASLAAERNSRWGGHPDHHLPGEATFMEAALRRTGFTEAGTIWQWLDDRVVVAVRGAESPAVER